MNKARQRKMERRIKEAMTRAEHDIILSAVSRGYSAYSAVHVTAPLAELHMAMLEELNE